MKPRHDPTILTARLALRLPCDSDVNELTTGIRDPGVSGMLARVPLPYYQRDAEAFVAFARRRAHEGKSLNLTIVHGDRVIGVIGIAALPVTCELGYWLARPFWGRGFATEAGTAVLAYGFEALGLKLIRSGVFADNRASLRVQRKLGFAVIGRSMRHSLARGVAVPHIDTVLTRSRYRALSQ